MKIDDQIEQNIFLIIFLVPCLLFIRGPLFRVLRAFFVQYYSYDDDESVHCQG